MQIFTNKVSKQKFVAKIRDLYWLFVWGGRDIRVRLNLLTFSNLNSSCMFSWWLFSDAFLYLGIGLLLMFRNMALDKKILEPYLAGESWSKKRQWTGLKRGWILSSSTYLQRNWIKTLLQFFSLNHRDLSSQISNYKDISCQITKLFLIKP